MINIEHVNINDVYPYEDEYGNEILSRDYSTKENQKYVKQLAESMREKGTPEELVQLRRDGGIFRIISGNSRVQAMRLLGTQSFDAVVLDDEEAEAALCHAIDTTVRTNTKKKYDPIEESRFVQQLALFRDDEYVAHAAGITPSDVKKIRKGRKVVGDDGDEMSLTRLMAISEFEGDEKAIKSIMECKENYINALVVNLHKKADINKAFNKIEDILRANGVEILDDKPDTDCIFCTFIDREDKLPDFNQPTSPTIAVRCSYWFATYRYKTAEETEKDVLESARREELKKQEAKEKVDAQAGRYRRREWLISRLANFNQTRVPNLSELAEGDIAEDSYGEDALRIFIEEGLRPTVGSFDVLISVLKRETGEHGIASFYKDSRGISIHKARNYIDLIEAMERDGYELTEDERTMFEEAKESINQQ